MQQAVPAPLLGIPPIVLIVDDDRDTLDMYSAYFESAGLWVATSSAPSEALDVVQELKPDAIITDVGTPGKPVGVELVRALKCSDATKDIPLILLSGRAVADLPVPTRRMADLCLVKPVLPENLLRSVRELIAGSQERSDPPSDKTPEPVETSERPGLRVARMAAPGTAPLRPCPACGGPLDWVEQGRIGGVTYDYYRWCLKGCGLYCFDRDAQTWLKLA